MDEKDLNEYQTGFGYLYDSDIISKLFWSIFDDKILDTAKITKVIINNIKSYLDTFHVFISNIHRHIEQK